MRQPLVLGLDAAPTRRPRRERVRARRRSSAGVPVRRSRWRPSPRLPRVRAARASTPRMRPRRPRRGPRRARRARRAVRAARPGRSSDWCACWPCTSTSCSPSSRNCASVTAAPLMKARLRPFASIVRRSSSRPPSSPVSSLSAQPARDGRTGTELGGDVGPRARPRARRRHRRARPAPAAARRSGSTCRRRFRRSAP